MTLPNSANSRYQYDLRQLMEVLVRNGNTATFFVTGQFYEENEQLIHEMVEQGFEVGYHSHTHPRLESRELLIKELQQSKSFLEAVNPKGFRAPWIYLPEALLEILPDWGFEYDSSTFGMPGSHYRIKDLDIYPVSSIKYFGRERDPVYPKLANLDMLAREFPIGSGIFVSLLRKVYPWIFNRYQSNQKPFVLYIHNWQLSIPPKKFNLLKDRLRYVHRFPLLNEISKWSRKFKFETLGSRRNNTGGNLQQCSSHYLTFDVEFFK